MEHKEEVKEVRSALFAFLPTALLIIVVIFLVFGGLRAVGLIGGVAVENIVYKNSFQYKEGMAQRAATLEASIIELDIRLNSNPENRQALINQKSILSAQLRAITLNP